MAVQGIDISTSQGTIQWPQVPHAGLAFAYVKASEGLQNDRNHAARVAYFRANWPRVRNAGLLRGAYHFFRANENAELQADIFIQAVGPLDDNDLPPMLDVETPDGVDRATRTIGVQAWLTKVEDEMGVTPLLYTSAGFWNAHMDDSFGDYPLWLAAYGADLPTAPATPTRALALPVGWTDYALWQYSQKGRVSGIKTSVDLDYFAGSLQELKDFSQSLRV